VELTYQDVVQQQISLETGYQFISLSVAPDDLNIESVLADILNSLEFLKDSDANLFRKIGPNWVNNIGDWNLTQGYLIKMSAAATLTIENQPVDPQTQINLTRTYQFIPYLPINPQDALTAWSTILDNLAFAKDSDANLLRQIGPNWINNIGNLNAGQGYLLKMNADDTFVYPESSQANIISELQNTIVRHYPEVSGN
ncbi:hypothetical protein PN36_35625, partial [Candidatus Thiomargarita nelsonii]